MTDKPALPAVEQPAGEQPPVDPASAAQGSPTRPGEPAGAERPDPAHPLWTVAGVAVLLGLGAGVHLLTEWVPAATAGTGFGRVAKSIEFPVYAIILGFAGNALLSVLGVRGRMQRAFRTEFLIKTGLVLLGASINFAVIARAALPAVAQAVLLISVVFGFTWWFAGLLGLDDKLRALLSSAVAICGVSAAVAAAGAVQAKKEQLAYTASLVIFFAVPMIFFLPWAADLLGLSPAVTGAWIGGNIDTTAAVTAAGSMAGEDVLQIATIVKVTQNALLGLIAVLLTIYFTVKVERRASQPRPRLITLWHSFPKFVLGFLIASVIATVFAGTVAPEVAGPAIGVANDLRTWFLILAFCSIGLEFSFGSLREAGWRPVLVFVAATAVNLTVGLLLAGVLWGGFAV